MCFRDETPPRLPPPPGPNTVPARSGHLWLHCITAVGTVWGAHVSGKHGEMGAKQRKGWALPDLDPTDPHSPTRWDLDVTQSACRRLHHLKVPLLPQIELPKGEPLGDIFKTVAPLDIWGLSVFICINHTIGVLWQCLQVSGTTGYETAQSSAQCIYFPLFS